MTKIKIYLNHLKKKLLFNGLLIPYLVNHPGHVRYFFKRSYHQGRISIVNLPWLTFGAIQWLEKNLNKSTRVFEWGSGGSTIFFSQQAGHVVSIEHNKEWYQVVKEALKKLPVLNYDYQLIESTAPKHTMSLTKTGLNEDEKRIFFKDYSCYIQKYSDNYFDIIVIDGRARNFCIEQAIAKVKRGGVIILDNSDRPEYDQGIQKLWSWSRKNFFGPGLRNNYFWETAIFTKTDKF